MCARTLVLCLCIEAVFGATSSINNGHTRQHDNFGYTGVLPSSNPKYRPPTDLTSSQVKQYMGSTGDLGSTSTDYMHQRYKPSVLGSSESKFRLYNLQDSPLRLYKGHSEELAGIAGV